MSALLQDASAPAFVGHPGYRCMFVVDALTLGLSLPLRFYQGDMQVPLGQTRLVEEIGRLGFVAVRVHDVPLFDPRFGDAGQVFDPFIYLGYLAVRIRRIALATGSAVLALRQPVDLTKAAASVDRLSGGRLVLGPASSDRPVEFPAHGLEYAQHGERFAQGLDYPCQLLHGCRHVASPLGTLDDAELLPRPPAGATPLVVTGSARQPADWLARQADGWLTYPESTVDTPGPRHLAGKTRTWRMSITDGGFRPHMISEWPDLVNDPAYPRTSSHDGYVLRTERNGLVELLGEWHAAGVNHAALGIQFSARPAAEVIQKLAEKVLPLLPSHPGVQPASMDWQLTDSVNRA